MNENKEVKKEEGRKNELEILFPEEVVRINGVEVIMRPLPLEQLPYIMTDLKDILEAMSANVPANPNVPSDRSGMSDAQSLGIGVSLITQIIKVLPKCTFKKESDGQIVPFNSAHLPAKSAYDLVKVFLKQNIPEELVGELTALTGVNPKNLKKKNG